MIRDITNMLGLILITAISLKGFDMYETSRGGQNYGTGLFHKINHHAQIHSVIEKIT